MAYKPAGVIIVGTGLIARFHAQAVNASEKLRLIAVVHPVKGRGDAFAAEFGVPLFHDYDEAFSLADAGMVLVASPSGAHDEAVLAAARHRMPVLVEKPLTITSERAERLIAACEETGTPLGGIFQTRFMDDFEDADLRLEVTDNAKDLVIARGYDPMYGARPLRRFLQQSVETLLARHIIANDLAPETVLTVDEMGGKLYIR